MALPLGSGASGSTRPGHPGVYASDSAGFGHYHRGNAAAWEHGERDRFFPYGKRLREVWADTER